MRKIVSVKFGSNLYGTATPASDLDFKSVHIPDGRSILLQRPQNHVATKRSKAHGEKNAAGAVEEDSYSLQRFLSLVAEGQPMALDMLFAPTTSMTSDPGWEWTELYDNRDKLLSKKTGMFLKYCRDQAAKYGIKGSRVGAARAALLMLNGLVDTVGENARLGDCSAAIDVMCAKTEHMAIVEIPQRNAEASLKHLEVCGKKMQYTLRLKAAREIVQRLVDEYGQRALQAERNEGIDWKAMSHAVRVGRQSLELLNTGHITFPLPYADHILDIKLGRKPYAVVAEELEDLLDEVERAAAASRLPEKPDQEWIDNFVERHYSYEVRDLGGGRAPSPTELV